MVDILDPAYVISELFGSTTLFIFIFLIFLFYICSKFRLNFQLTALVIVFAMLTMPLILPGTQTWFAVITVIIGIFAAYVFYQFINRG